MGNPPQKQTQNPESTNDEEQEIKEFTCEICIEQIILPNKRFNNEDKCVHSFCSNCIIKYIDAKIDDNLCEIQCPALDCDNSLEPLSCRHKIPRQLFDRWSQLLLNSTVLTLDGVYCPNRNCCALVVNECGGDVRRCVCPDCKKPFCFFCKIPWHAGYGCEESGKQRDRNDVAFGELMKKMKWRRCPKCRQWIELVSGCNYVRCRCGTAFDYYNGTSLTRGMELLHDNQHLLIILFITLLFVIIMHIGYFVSNIHELDMFLYFFPCWIYLVLRLLVV